MNTIKAQHTPTLKICIDAHGKPLSYENGTYIKVVSIIGSNYALIGGKDKETLASYIGRAVNSHEELLEACKIKISECPHCRGDFDIECQTCHHMKAAIAKATGENK